MILTHGDYDLHEKECRLHCRSTRDAEDVISTKWKSELRKVLRNTVGHLGNEQIDSSITIISEIVSDRIADYNIEDTHDRLGCRLLQKCPSSHTGATQTHCDAEDALSGIVWRPRISQATTQSTRYTLTSQSNSLYLDGVRLSA